MTRRVEIERKTKETDIRLALDVEEAGQRPIQTGVPFLDHLLGSMSFHGGFSLELKGEGDVEVDQHHLVEDIGLVLGSALAETVSRHGGVQRFAWAVIPMDEALVEVAMDVCGRPASVLVLDFPQPRVGTFDVALLREFLVAMASTAKMSLHVTVRHGENSHHIAEAMFKALGKAIAQAYRARGEQVAKMSTKGTVSFS